MRNKITRALLFLAAEILVFGPRGSSAQTPAAEASRVAAPATGHASAASKNPGSRVAPPISATVAEVSLDLTVQTKHHKPVRDLQASQLAVTDDGSPVQLSSLSLVDGTSGPQRLVTLVFDRLSGKTAKNVRAMAEKILKVIPGQDYSLAVLQVDGRLRLLQPYTQDAHLIDAAIDQATPAAPAPPSAVFTPAEKTLLAAAPDDSLAANASGRAQGKLLLSALEQSQRIVEERHVYPSLAALQALVLSDRLQTGRRFIFYFSNGLTLNSDGRDTLRSIVGLANRAGISICVVDNGSVNGKFNSAMQSAEASSLLGSGSAGSSISSFGSGGGSAPSPHGIQQGAVVGDVATHYTSEFEFGDAAPGDSPLVPLARGTGGVYFSASGSSKRQLKQLQQDLTTWYQASWTPSSKNYDGEFHPITIHSLRKGVVVRARSGYFAVPPAESSAILPFEMPMLDMLAASPLPTDVAFHARILHLGDLPDGNSGELIVQVPVSQLTIHQDGNTHISSVHAAIVAVIKDSKGKVLKRFGEDFPLHETPEMFSLNSGQAITLQRHFSAEPGTYTLETAVSDQIANKAGAQRSTFTIDAPPVGPALSDIALVDSIQPLEQDDQAFEPMRYLNGRVVPNLSTDLSADTHSLSLFFLLHPVDGSQSQPTLRIQVFHDQHLLTEMPMQLHKVSGTGAAVPYLEEIQGTGFAPGDYQVKALLTQDGTTVSSSAAFHVDTTLAVASPGSGLPDSPVDPKASTANSHFVISTPADPLPPPTALKIHDMIEGTRQNALTWFRSLPNFFCAEVTEHSVDSTGHGDWKHKDTLVELMRYVNHGESRRTVMLDGDRSSADPDELQFAHSAGEYGAMFHIVFNPSAKAVFTWKESASLDGQPVQVFTFKVAQPNSAFQLTDRDGHTFAVGFHGLLYLDPATRSVRRISIVADDIPSKLLIDGSSMSVDYSWISMQNHDFLLPIRGAAMLHEAKRRAVLNQFEFRDYRRFGSQVRIVANDKPTTAPPPTKPQP